MAKSLSPSHLKRRLNVVKAAIADLERGLDGHPFSWGMAEAESKQGVLLALGFTLCTKSYLEKGGHELKRGVKPVGKRYYGKPLSKHADLYVLEVQANRSLKWHDLYHKNKALLEAPGRVTIAKPFVRRVQESGGV